MPSCTNEKANRKFFISCRQAQQGPGSHTYEFLAPYWFARHRCLLVEGKGGGTPELHTGIGLYSVGVCARVRFVCGLVCQWVWMWVHSPSTRVCGSANFAGEPEVDLHFRRPSILGTCCTSFNLALAPSYQKLCISLPYVE